MRFETKDHPTTTMLGEVAGKLLRLMGMSGDVPGAIEGRGVGEGLARLLSGLARLEPESGVAATPDDGDDEEAEVGLTVRAFPLLELLSHASGNGHYVVWTQKESMNQNRVSEPSPGRPPIDPSTALAREDLTLGDKVALLKDLQLDLSERMTATDENMSVTQEESQLAEQFRRVSRALSVLEPNNPGP